MRTLKTFLCLSCIIAMIFSINIPVQAYGGGTDDENGILEIKYDKATPKHQALSMTVDSIPSDSSLQAFCIGWNFKFSNGSDSISVYVPLSNINTDGGSRTYTFPLTTGWTKEFTGIAGGKSIRDLVSNKAKYDKIIKNGCTVHADARIRKYNYSGGKYSPLDIYANSKSEIDNNFSDFSFNFKSNTKSDYFDLVLTLLPEPPDPKSIPTPSVTLSIPEDGSTVVQGTTITFKGFGTGCHHIGGFVDGIFYAPEQVNPNEDIAARMEYETTVKLDEVKDYTVQIRGRNTAFSDDEGSKLAESEIHTVHVVAPEPDKGSIYIRCLDYSSNAVIASRYMPNVPFGTENEIFSPSLNGYTAKASYTSDNRIIPKSSVMQTGVFSQTVILSKTNSDAYVYFWYDKVKEDLKGPVAIIDAPEKVKAGNEFTVSGSRSYCTQAGATIKKYEWSTGLDAVSGIACFKAPGTYAVKLTVTDSNGLTGSTTHYIEVTPPTPVARYTLSGKIKENRKITVNACSSISPDSYDIDWRKTRWHIEPITSSGATWEFGIKLQDGTIKRIDQETDQSFLNGQAVFDFQARYAGNYRLTLSVSNSYPASDTITGTIAVAKDLAPVSKLEVQATALREYENPSDKTKRKYAVIPITDKSYSPDGDTIGKRVWSYRWNSKNKSDTAGNPIFTDDVTRYKYEGDLSEPFLPIEEQRLAVKNDNDTKAEIWSYDIGKYGMQVVSEETISDEETIKELLLPSDIRKTDISDYTNISDINNLPPLASLNLSKKRSIDINIANDGSTGYSTVALNSKLNEILKPKLAQEGIDFKINILEATDKLIYSRQSDIKTANFDTGKIFYTQNKRGPFGIDFGDNCGGIKGTIKYTIAPGKLLINSFELDNEANNDNANLANDRTLQVKFYSDYDKKTCLNSETITWSKLGRAKDNSSDSDNSTGKDITINFDNEAKCFEFVVTGNFTISSKYGGYFSYMLMQDGNSKLPWLNEYPVYNDKIKRKAFISENIANMAWRQDTEKYYLDFSNRGFSENIHGQFKTESILSLLNKNISLIKIGNQSSKSDANILIGANNENGQFIDNSSLDKAIQELADYIIPKANLNDNIKKNAVYVVASENETPIQFEPGGLDDSTGVQCINSGAIRSKEYFSVESNGSYTINKNGSGIFQVKLFCYDSDFRLINNPIYFAVDKKFTLPHGSSYIKVLCGAIDVNKANSITITDDSLSGGEAVDYKPTVTDPENDTSDIKFKFDHDNKNIAGMAITNQTERLTLSGAELSSPIERFSKPGTYKVSMYAKDIPKLYEILPDPLFDDYRKTSKPATATIYAHRLPIAEFTYQIENSAGAFKIKNLVDNKLSYDPDHIDKANKGIVNSQWRWAEVTPGGMISWHDGKVPETLFFPTGTQVLIYYRVQDSDGLNGIGAWSFPKVAGTDGSLADPVALFVATPILLPMQKELTITDQSYSPNYGATIASRSWTIKKAGSPAQTLTFDKTDTANNKYYKSFTSLGFGKYTITLTVTDSFGKVSKPYSRTVEVIDTINPNVSVNYINGTFAEEVGAVITVTCTDSELSKSYNRGLKTISYAWSKSTVEPQSTDMIKTINIPIEGIYEKSFIASQAQEGTWYLYVKDQDHAGNTNNDDSFTRFGPYTIEAIKAGHFYITMMLDAGWRAYYYDINNGIYDNHDGKVDRYPRRSNTDIGTLKMPINYFSLVEYNRTYIKAGYKVKGKIDIIGIPDWAAFNISYIINGRTYTDTVALIKASGDTYTFEWIIPLETDNKTFVSFDLVTKKGNKTYGNEKWTDTWDKRNTSRLVFYVMGKATDDLIYVQSQ